MTAKVRVIRAKYRGEPGYVIVGTDTHGRRVSIFTKSESKAREIQSAIKADRDWHF